MNYVWFYKQEGEYDQPVEYMNDVILKSAVMIIWISEVFLNNSINILIYKKSLLQFLQAELSGSNQQIINNPWSQNKEEQQILTFKKHEMTLIL